MKYEEVLAMLKDETKPIDLDAVLSCLEVEHGRAVGVYQVLSLGTDESKEAVKRIEALLQVETELGTRRQKLVDAIVGKLEMLDESSDVGKRFRVRAETMNFEQLDAELEDVESKLREKLGTSRVTKPSDSENLLSGRVLSNYRV